MNSSGSTIPSATAPASSQLGVRGMTCQNCARQVREALQSVPGVAQATVALEAQRATIRWAAGATPDIEAAVGAVRAAGYEAAAIEAGAEPAAKRAWSGWALNLALGVPVTAVLMLGEWAFGLGTGRWFPWLAFALATVVQVVCGAGFYRGAWRQLKAGSSNMDTLVALGSSTAYGYSLWALARGAHVYFMEAAAIITLISVGHWIESRMSERAAGSMKKLLGLAPAQARRRSARAVEELVPIAELRAGDLVVLRPGERVPTDGIVIEGASSVDEAMLTGESLPADKAPGASVYGGTVNVNSVLVLRVTATGEATALAQIIAAVTRAQHSRANIQRLGDRVSSVFVPVVVLVALATALWWGLAPESATSASQWLAPFLWPLHLPETALAMAVVHMAAVLIIACPCAMGLATPAAIMAGTNAAAERGILIRDGIALEKAGTITTVVFDKTGTLTRGRPEVVKELVLPGAPADALELATELARQSNHPLSQAIAAHAGVERRSPTRREGGGPAAHAGVERRSPTRREGGGPAAHAGSETGAPLREFLSRGAAPLTTPAWKLSFENATRKFSIGQVSAWQEVRGAGVQARVGSRTARLGSLRWLEESSVRATEEAFIAEWTGRGATVVGLALDSELAALFVLKDTLKDGAAEVVKELRAQNLAVHLISGDNRRAAEAVGCELGIDAAHIAAEVRPEQKAEMVRALQAGGAKVAFVGDGINDAPALEQADLGIAVGRASDVAQMAADIVLLKSDVRAVAESLGLARATLRAIRQNLFWAFFYNAAGIPLAALGFLSPVLCALAMGLSDAVVIGNALRLRRWGR